MLFIAAIFWLKMVSYFLANREYRRMWLAGKPTAEEVEGVDPSELVSYPHNLTLKSMFPFSALVNNTFACITMRIIRK